MFSDSTRGRLETDPLHGDGPCTRNRPWCYIAGALQSGTGERGTGPTLGPILILVPSDRLTPVRRLQPFSTAKLRDPQADSPACLTGFQGIPLKSYFYFKINKKIKQKNFVGGPVGTIKNDVSILRCWNFVRIRLKFCPNSEISVPQNDDVIFDERKTEITGLPLIFLQFLFLIFESQGQIDRLRVSVEFIQIYTKKWKSFPCISEVT